MIDFCIQSWAMLVDLRLLVEGRPEGILYRTEQKVSLLWVANLRIKGGQGSGLPHPTLSSKVIVRVLKEIPSSLKLWAWRRTVFPGNEYISSCKFSQRPYRTGIVVKILHTQK